MRVDQRKKALEKIHSVAVDVSSTSSVENVTSFLGTSVDPILKEILNAGVDWIPQALLATLVSRAIPLAKDDGHVIAQGNDTYIVTSQSNPRKPHIVNRYPNGKTECDNCPGFIAKKICKHTVAVNIKLKQMDGYLSWLVSSQRRSGGINISKAITYGMPRGRGKKGNKAPRKKSRRVGETITAFVPPDLAVQLSKPNASPSAQAMIGSQCTTSARLTQSLVLPSPSPSPQHLQPQYFLPLPLISNPQQSSQTSHLERTGATTALGRGHNSILSGQVSSSADSNPPQPQHVLFPNPNPANPAQLAHLRPQRVMFPNPNHANPPQLVQLQPQRATFPNPNPANQPQLVQLQPQRATFSES